MSWPQRSLDTRALEMAAETRANFRDHQNECKERYLENDRKLDGIRAALDAHRKDREEGTRRLYGLMWKGMGALVLLLLSIIGYLLDKGGLPLQHP